MKTILVLGGAGYIGSHTVYELIDNGYDVVIVDNLETGFRKAVHPKARFYQGDIRNKEFCDHVFSSEKIDAVIHFAANSQVGESMVNPLKYYDNNLGGTRTMLQSKDELGHGIDNSIFLFHDKSQKTVDALPRIIEGLLADEYQLVTVSELLNCSEEGLHSGWIYSKAD